ncbi:MAG: VWA domain-containing protein [Chloroflexota bacterium]
MRKISIALVVLALTGVLTSAQNLLEVNPAATLTAYQCRFNGQTNQSEIRASLVGADGLPIPRDAYRIAAQLPDTGDLVRDAAVSANNVPERPPLDMILVMDITNTMEIESVVSAVERSLMPQLQLEDRVALITFAEDVSPRTQFYTDKNRLLNEHMFDLVPGQGDNRLYDAIFDAVTEFPLNEGRRKVVLALTDSNRRDIAQTELDDIITRAQRETVQVYSVGINTFADQPDVIELEQLGEATGGYTWVYDANIITRASIEGGVADSLDAFVDTLNSEILTRIDLDGLEPDQNGFIQFRLGVATNNDSRLFANIACPVEELFHFIEFDDTVPEGDIQGPVDLAVNFESDLPNDQVAVSFVAH